MQKFPEWFIKECIQHNLDLISQARKIFRPQNDDETVLSDETDFLWNPEWSQVLFFNVPSNNWKAAVATISILRDCLKVTLLKTGNTSFIYNARLNEKQFNHTLNSWFMIHKKIKLKRQI